MPLKSRNQIAGENVLKKYSACQIKGGRMEEEKLLGIQIAGWTIRSASSPIGNEGQMETLSNSLQELVLDDARKILIPEIVFSQAFVSLKYSGEGLNENSEKEGVEINYTAIGALEEWAKCHAHLSYSSSSHKGVSVIKTIDAKLWEARQSREHHQSPMSLSLGNQNSTSTPLFGKSASAAALQNYSTEINYDWTFSSPYAGSISACCNADECSHSGIDEYMHLLTDQSQPILYFDDVHLFEDDMHDNGYVSLRCKIRVMPTCFFVLLTLFVRVDHVLIRVKESRTFCKFQVDDDQIRVYRDISWKECPWEKLSSLNFPARVGSWRIEEEEVMHQSRIQGMLRTLPSVPLPDGVQRYSCYSFPKH